MTRRTSPEAPGQGTLSIIFTYEQRFLACQQRQIETFCQSSPVIKILFSPVNYIERQFEKLADLVRSSP